VKGSYIFECALNFRADWERFPLSSPGQLEEEKFNRLNRISDKRIIRLSDYPIIRLSNL